MIAFAPEDVHEILLNLEGRVRRITVVLSGIMPGGESQKGREWWLLAVQLLRSVQRDRAEILARTDEPEGN